MIFEDRKEEIEQRVAQIRRVARVTAGGRRFSFSALVIAGDKKGKVGMGIGKANDVTEAVNKAGRQAIKKMAALPLQDGTIPFEISTRFKMTKIFLKPVPKGRGVIAGGVVRDICELAGIQNINGKIVSASKSKINNAKAVLRAFDKIKQIHSVKQALHAEHALTVSAKIEKQPASPASQKLHRGESSVTQTKAA